MTEVGNDIRAQVSGSLITAREDLAMYRIRFILTGAVFGIAWACSLRGFMQQLAGADSTFTFAGTFGVIIPAGTVVGALRGWTYIGTGSHVKAVRVGQRGCPGEAGRAPLACVPVWPEPARDRGQGRNRLAGWRWVTVILVSGSPQ